MEPTQAAGIAGFLSQADSVGKAAPAVLLVMSAATWYLITTKSIQWFTARRRTERFLATFWDAPSLHAVAAHLASRSPISQGSSPRAITSATCKQPDRGPQHRGIRHAAMRRVIDDETSRFESGLTLRASLGGTAPFVGLFGTVWAVYHALINIGMSGQGTLDKVAGPVGEALIMTALGLLVAVPAVLAYNAFVRSNRVVLARVDAFAYNPFAVLTTGSHVNGAGSVVPLNPATAEQGGHMNEEWAAIGGFPDIERLRGRL